MYLTKLLSATELQREPVPDRDVVILPTGIFPWCDVAMTMRRQDWDAVYVECRAVEPDIEPVFATILSGANTGIFHMLGSMEKVQARYTELREALEAQENPNAPVKEGQVVEPEVDVELVIGEDVTPVDSSEVFEQDVSVESTDTHVNDEDELLPEIDDIGVDVREDVAVPVVDDRASGGEGDMSWEQMLQQAREIESPCEPITPDLPGIDEIFGEEDFSPESTIEMLSPHSVDTSKGEESLPEVPVGEPLLMGDEEVEGGELDAMLQASIGAARNAPSEEELAGNDLLFDGAFGDASLEPRSPLEPEDGGYVRPEQLIEAAMEMVEPVSEIETPVLEEYTESDSEAAQSEQSGEDDSLPSIDEVSPPTSPTFEEVAARAVAVEERREPEMEMTPQQVAEQEAFEAIMDTPPEEVIVEPGPSDNVKAEIVAIMDDVRSSGEVHFTARESDYIAPCVKLFASMYSDYRVTFMNVPLERILSSSNFTAEGFAVRVGQTIGKWVDPSMMEASERFMQVYVDAYCVALEKMASGDEDTALAIAKVFAELIYEE